VLLYLVLWALTQFVGAGQVRAVVAEKNMPLADCPRLESCESAAVAVAPFLVRAAYFWDSGSLAGDGANVLYVWVGGVGFEVWRWNEIAI